MPTTAQADPAVSAVRAALDAAGHELSELLVFRPDRDADHLVVRFNPLSSDTWDLEEEQTTAYAKTLRRAGWESAVDLSALVFIPYVPAPTTAPRRTPPPGVSPSTMSTTPSRRPKKLGSASSTPA